MNLAIRREMHREDHVPTSRHGSVFRHLVVWLWSSGLPLQISNVQFPKNEYGYADIMHFFAIWINHEIGDGYRIGFRLRVDARRGEREPLRCTPKGNLGKMQARDREDFQRFVGGALGALEGSAGDFTPGGERFQSRNNFGVKLCS